MLCLFLSILPLFNPVSLCVCSPKGIPLLLCISLSPSVCFSSNSLLLCLSLTQTINEFIPPLFCLVFQIPDLFIYLFYFVTVVLWILPRSQPWPELLWIPVQDQRAEKEVVGSVRHGHVSSAFASAAARYDISARLWYSSPRGDLGLRDTKINR